MAIKMAWHTAIATWNPIRIGDVPTAMQYAAKPIIRALKIAAMNENLFMG